MEASLENDVVVRSVRFTAGDVFSHHTHKDGQFALATGGSISMITDLGSWIVPAQRAIWVPPMIGHEMHMHGDVTMLNVFIAGDVAQQVGLPSHCQVFGVSVLLRTLLETMLVEPMLPSSRWRHLQGVLIDELGDMPHLPLDVPLPREHRLARACRQFLIEPDQSRSIDEMALAANMSRRTFTRQFRDSTGMTFLQWRKLACALEALSRLARGATVKDVSVDLGYSSASAFITTFREMFGLPPKLYLAQHANYAHHAFQSRKA